MFVVENNIVHAREVTVAAELPHMFVISSGIDENDHVLLEGIRCVRDGDQIVANERDPSDVVAELDVHAE